MNERRLFGYEGNGGTSAADMTRASEVSMPWVELVSLKRLKKVS